ncbi:uncharacterized protein LOC143905688 [Temnothorax americanus]|uniref:uncharacterized protein LOC143905688 n=1 Tax=Temnothorax americanus TaxID=1964332 RepID=UPI004068792B
MKKRPSKRLTISSDSMDSTDSSSKTITEKRTSKRNVKFEKIVKRKMNSNCIHSSDSESDENDTKRASNVSKRISKDTRQQNKKMENSYNAKKDKAKRCHDSTSESEDEEHKKRSRKKRSETSRTSHGSNDERKRDKSSNSRFSNIQEDDSDNSSSKEFQKKKLQKVNRNKFSRRKLVDLEIDHTKSPSVKNSVNDKSEKQIDKQADQNFNVIKKILKDCKNKCSDFQMFIESIEQLYGKEDERLILKSAEIIDNLKTVLEEKRKDLTTSCQLWSKNRKKSATKRYKEISDDEQSSEECKKRTVDEDIRISGDEQGGNKAVSECDSEEIFSANKTKTGKKQKMQAAQSKASTTRTKNNNGTNTDEEENRMSVDESKNNDKDNMDIRNDLAISPVIGTLKEKKTSTERSSKKQLLSECNKNNNKIQPTNENTNTNDKASLNTDIYNDETEIEDSPSRDNCKERTLENDEVGQSSKRNMINESTDLFDTSFEDAGENRTEVEIETNCDKEKLLHTSKDKFSDPCKDALKDKVPDEKERASLLSYNIKEEEDLSNQIAQEKMAPSATKEAHDDSKTNGKTNTDNESLDDAEALAKKALLATDSDTSDTLPDKNVAKLTEDLKITNDTNQTEKNKTEDDDSNSVSTVMLSTFIKEANTDEKDTISDEGKTKVEKKSDNRLDKKSRKKKSSSDEDAKIAKAERAAKRALLESNSDDSTPLSSESEKLTDKKSESDSSEKNTKAKLSLLASSSEISSPEMANVSKSTKRNYELDRESAVTRLKKRRLNLDKNYYYKNDKTLRMSCKVHLNRLSAEVLKCHSRALGKSTEYLEHKALKSLINLDKLEKSRKKNAKKDSDLLTDDDSSSKIARSSNKQMEKAKAKEESLMDHLKRIENDNISPTVEMDSDTDIEESAHQISKVNDIPVSNEALMSEADRVAKENLLNTSDSSEKEVAVDSDDNLNNDDKDKTVENKKKKQKTEEKTSKQDSKKDKSDWRRDKLLTTKFSDTDSESEREKWKKKQKKIANESKENNSDSDEERLKSKKKKKKKKKGARRILDSDSDVKITDVDSDSSEASSAKQNSSDSESDLRREKEKLRRKRRKRGDSNSSDTDSSLTEKKSKPKRKRIKKMASDSDSSNAEIKNSQGSTPGKSHRKNIRKVLKNKQVAEDTKLAAKEEEERLKRIAERQALSKKDKSDWRRDKLLTTKFSDTDSESEREKWKKKQKKIANESKENNSDSDEERLKSKKKKKKKKKGARRILDSDSDVKITDVDSDSSEASSAKQNSSDSESDLRREKEKLRRKRRKRGDSNSSDTDSSLTEKKSKPKRKRIKKMASDSDSSNAEIKNSQGSTPGKSHRKNIRKVLKNKQVAEDTKLAAKEEEERLKRIAERQALSKKDKSDWRRDKLLTTKFSDTDSESEREKWKKKQKKIANESKENNSDSDEERLKSKKKKKKKKKGARRILDSDSDVKITDVDSDSSEASSAKQNSSDSESDLRREKEKLRRKRRKRGDSNSSDTDSSLTEKKSKPKRKRIKKMASDSDSSNAEIKNSQGSTPGKSHRKNIRKVLKNKQVAEDTKLAAKEEEERLKRIAERQALYNEMYEMRLAGEEKVDKLVLDFDTETKKELVTVHEELVKRLKPHQAQGIKFMWDACFESLERVKTTSGSGCIIAHCMGLGKTLQVIALTHTLLTHEETNIKTVLIVCPLSTVLNWRNEYNTWLKDLDDIEVYEMTKCKKHFERKYQLQSWQRTGGVMIIGYEMFRNLTGPNKTIRKGMKEAILKCLVDPGADVVVCDEGHLLKKEDTALSKCMRSVKTLRRIVLTGTPLQNNLIEYHCMVQFVKPNLLGTKKEFLNRFVNPITNGQFDDSIACDVKLMKQRAHVLHKMLEGSVQRFDYSVLTPFLPPKQEYVIFVRLTDTQVKMYQYYLENLARIKRHTGGRGGTLFADFQALQRIWTHPVVLRMNAEKKERANENKELSDSEGSLKDFINDDSTDIETTSINSDSTNDDKNVPKPSRGTRNNPVEEEPEEEHKKENTESEWWMQFVQSEHFEDMRVSAKLLLLFGILKECEQIGDKLLVFSQSLYFLTLIEEFLRRIDDQTQNDTLCETLDNHTGSWSLGLDYFRLDGQTSAKN